MILTKLIKSNLVHQTTFIKVYRYANLRHQLSTSSVMSSKNSFIINQALINGKWVNSSSTFPVVSPASGQLVAEAAECDEANLLAAIEASKQAFKKWSLTTAKERSSLIYRLYELHLKHKDELAELITLEMGKPINESKNEIVYGASFLQWFSEQAKRINGEILQSPWPDKMIMYTKEPIGPIAIITPWNFPNAMITRKLAAALAIGCTVVIRPCHTTPFSALAIGKLAEKAGIPPGVINVVPSSHYNASKFGKILCESKDIAAVSFTGSTRVGKLLIEQGASTVKRMCLELGGNASFIVFDSADLDKAVQGCMASKFRNTGQTCVCANRIFVQSSVHDAFVAKLKSEMDKQLKVGDPLDQNTTIGPLVSEDALLKVREHVQDAISKGGKLVTGGKLHEKMQKNSKLFFEPTLITDVKNNMRVCNEETFGPLAAVIKFDCEEEVLELANSTRVGLASYFFSRDIGQIRRVSRGLKAGMIGVNDGILSCAESPFGGVKESGLGREGSHLGIDEFSDIKSVIINTS